MHKIAVLGVGPGSPAYLPPATADRAGRCDLLVGGRRNLSLFNNPGQEKLEIRGSLEPVISAVRARAHSCRIGFLVSGDTGIYSILPRLTREFGRSALDVYPGISAAQYMFARLALAWQDAKFVSLHGREISGLAETIREVPVVALFTDAVNSPAAVCSLLLGAGMTEKIVCIGEDLSYPTERISVGRPADFTGFSGSDLNMVVITDE